jgi:GT2 family glycosyltransferase
VHLSIITVTWNSAEHIIEQMRSVEKAAAGLEYEQIIIDNGSYDDTVGRIREAFPTVRLILNKTNRGFALANNLGYRASRGEFLLFLNPDMVLMPGTLAPWVGWAQSCPKLALSGPRLVNAEGEVNKEALPRRFPTFLNQMVALTFLSRFFSKIVDHYRMKDFNVEREQVVDSVRGSCLLARRTFLDELGFAFDPRYFFWFEDVDLCKEVYNHGYEVRYNPNFTAIDLVGRSFAKRSSSWKRKNFLRSMLVYFWKWGFFS